MGFGLLAIPHESPVVGPPPFVGLQTTPNGLLISDGTSPCDGKPCDILDFEDISGTTAMLVLDGIQLCFLCQCADGTSYVAVTLNLNGAFTLPHIGDSTPPAYTCQWLLADDTGDIVTEVFYNPLLGLGCTGVSTGTTTSVELSVSIGKSGCDYFVFVQVDAGGECFRGRAKICDGTTAVTITNELVEADCVPARFDGPSPNCSEVSGGNQLAWGGTATVLIE